MCDLTNPIFTDEDAAREWLEKQRWPDGAYCPLCGQIDTVAKDKGKSMGKGWYHCRDCRKRFTVRVGTLYERSHIPLHKWLLATHLLCASKKGISAHQLHRMLGITYKSAWFMAHRIREGMKETDPGGLGGPGISVEADETFIGTKRKPGRHPDGRRKRKTGADKMKVVSLVQRRGPVRSFVVDRITATTVQEILFTNVHRMSDLMTDEAAYYKAAGDAFAGHRWVNHSQEEYARGLGIHVNTLENYFSIFKRGMKGVYQHCGEQHLQRYVCEFDFRYNTRTKLGWTDADRAVKAIKGIEGKRLTYRRPHRAEIAQAESQAI